MILGRSTSLWIGLFAAAINVVTIVFRVPLTGEQVATLNAFALALVGVLGNVSATGTAFGRGWRE